MSNPVHSPFSESVSSPEAAKDSKADVSKLEHQIDQLVYQLYGLTPEEIAIVEART